MQSVVVGPHDLEIVALEARLRDAQLLADIDTLDALLADELLFTGPDGALATKAQDLDAHRSGAIRFREHTPEELRIRRIGSSVAVTNLRARLAVEVGGTLLHGVFRYTRIWARENSETWRVVGGHVSALQEQPTPSATHAGEA